LLSLLLGLLFLCIALVVVIALAVAIAHAVVVVAVVIASRYPKASALGLSTRREAASALPKAGAKPEGRSD
jgi:hypothetical protein